MECSEGYDSDEMSLEHESEHDGDSESTVSSRVGRRNLYMEGWSNWDDEGDDLSMDSDDEIPLGLAGRIRAYINALDAE